MTQLILLVATAQGGVIGNHGHLPWQLPVEMGRFKTLTDGKTILMGRRTFENLPKSFRPLPNRTNLVLTSQRRLVAPEGVTFVHSLTEVLENPEQWPEIWVLGGASVFEQCLPYAQRIEMTEIHQEVTGNMFLEPLTPGEWEQTHREHHEGEPSYDFISYNRLRPSYGTQPPVILPPLPTPSGPQTPEPQPTPALVKPEDEPL